MQHVESWQDGRYPACNAHPGANLLPMNVVVVVKDDRASFPMIHVADPDEEMTLVRFNDPVSLVQMMTKRHGYYVA